MESDSRIIVFINPVNNLFFCRAILEWIDFNLFIRVKVFDANSPNLACFKDKTISFNIYRESIKTF